MFFLARLGSDISKLRLNRIRLDSAQLFYGSAFAALAYRSSLDTVVS